MSGRTVGSISRLPLLNTTSGKPLYLLNRAPLTRPTCAHILELDARMSCGDAPQDWSSHCKRLFSAPSCWRLRLPLLVTEARCECGAGLDQRGRHRAACPQSGRLRTRAIPTERTLARVCREAGASVRCNAKLRDMNTLRSALTFRGEAQPNAANVNGAVLAGARQEKATKCCELLEGTRYRLIVGMETDGRWSEEALGFVEMPRVARARDASPALKRSAFLVCADGHGCFRSLAAVPLLVPWSPRMALMVRCPTSPTFSRRRERAVHSRNATCFQHFPPATCLKKNCQLQEKLLLMCACDPHRLSSPP